MDERTIAIRDKFAGGLMAYMDDYFLSKYCIIYKPKVDYSIPNEEFIRKNWGEICDELRTLKPIHEYSKELDEVAMAYLPIFLKECPQYKNEQWLSHIK